MIEAKIPEDLDDLKIWASLQPSTGKRSDNVDFVDGITEGHRQASVIAIERIAELEDKLVALQWRPITESDMPKVGDEMWQSGADSGVERIQGWIDMVEKHHTKIDFRTLTSGGGYSHFRPINPPTQDTKDTPYTSAS